MWQNSSGDAAIWEDGAAVIGGSTIGDPGTVWHVKGSGDFNGDSFADILWQNDSGEAAIWEMNGAAMSGGGIVANPGPSWHI